MYIDSIESFLEVLKANDDSHPQVEVRGVGYPETCLDFCETPGSSATIADALAKNTSIKDLTLCNLTKSLKLGAAGAKLIGDAIGNNTALKDLSLVDMCDEYVEGMADGAGKSVSLTKLEAINVTAQGVATIGRILGQSSSLVELVVKASKFIWRGKGYSIEPDGTTGIAGGITKSKTIQKLNISKCGITKTGADALWCALETSPSLRELDISKNDIGDSQVAKGVATLQKLNVNLCGIVGKKGVDAIGRALETSTSLVELDISSNRIGDVGARSLAQGLTKNTSLKNLKAFGCNVKGPGSKVIGIALGSNSTLEELRWGTPMYEKDEEYGDMQEFGIHHPEAVQWGNHIAKVGAEGFAEGLAKNRALKVLDLSDTRIESNGAQAIGKSLESNSHLCELNLQGTSFSAKGMKCLGDSLGKNVALTSLNLNENWFGDMGAVALGRGMVGNTSLKSLQLINCKFKEAGARSIGYALGTMPAMQKINMAGNYIGNAGGLALANAIARNRSLENVRIGQSLSIEYAGHNCWYCDHRYEWSDETLANFESAIRSSMPRAATLKIKETNSDLFKDLVALCEKKLQDQPMLVAFGMGMHKRLGEGSIVQGLGSDIFKLVAKIGFESLELPVERMRT
jgi:Ran GTPase-activating protein (RanGAP) involved in mRNA processing and transport